MRGVYTQSILMQLALARKEGLFNGSIIASSSFYSGSKLGCNYFHTWFNTWRHWHTQYMHTPRLLCIHIHRQMKWSWHAYTSYSVTRFFLKQRSRMATIRSHQCWHLHRIPKQQIETRCVWRLMCWLWMCHPKGGQLCLPAVLQSHLAALY